MKELGGILPFEPTLPQNNGFLQKISPLNGELNLMMSGRCGIFRCLSDIAKTDHKKIAYVPIYTCETVLAPFIKAGYQLIFYNIDRTLKCLFSSQVLDKISVLSLCGYYGFISYDPNFVYECKRRKITIFQDTTHSIFSSNGIDPLCDYFAGSFRKWIGVPCGGFAAKTEGKFITPLISFNSHHVDMRFESIQTNNNELFWKTEMYLREIFGNQSSDSLSRQIIQHMDIESLITKRRKNFHTILSHIPRKPHGFKAVFPALTEECVPSHFVIYAKKRDHLQKFLKENHIHSTVYWPINPFVNLDDQIDANYVYNHILALPCDQRYSTNDMLFIAKKLNDYSSNFGGTI